MNLQEFNNLFYILLGTLLLAFIGAIDTIVKAVAERNSTTGSLT
jgi:hypothetical protein